MKDAMYGLLGWAVIISLCVLVPYSCNRVQQAREGSKKQSAENELSEFCKANNAVPAFKDLPDTGVLSIDLQRAVFVKGKHVAFKGQLLDLYRSEKLGALVARFEVNHSDSQIGVSLKCTESQLQQLHDAYQKDKNATFMIAAEFDEIEPLSSVNGKGVETPLVAHENYYSVVGRLVSFGKSEFQEPSKTDSEDVD